MEIKPGYETTEFWGAFFAQIVGLGLAMGILSPAQASAATAQAASIGGVAVMVISLVSYIASRTSVKRAYVAEAAQRSPAPVVSVPLPVGAVPAPRATDPLPDSPPAPSYAPITAPRPAIVAPTTVTIASSI